MGKLQVFRAPARAAGPTRRGTAPRLPPDAAEFLRRARAGDGPAWRWSRVSGLIERGEQPDRLDDPATVAAWAYRRDTASADGAAARTPRGRPQAAMSAAHAVYLENGPRRWQVDAWLLAGLGVDAAARRVGLPGDVVRAYADTFFDVVGRLNARDWIWLNAVRVGLWGPADPTEADVWRYAAATGGPAVLEVLVGDYLGWPGAEAGDRHALAEDIRTLVRFVTTPPSAKRTFRRVMKQMWRIAATRLACLDPVAWEEVAGHLEFLEAASRTATTTARAGGQDEPRVERPPTAARQKDGKRPGRGLGVQRLAPSGAKTIAHDCLADPTGVRTA